MPLGSAPSPLSAFSSASSQNPLQIAPPPKLSDFVQQSGLMAGMKAFDDALAQWAQTLQMNLNNLAAPTANSNTPPKG